MNVADQIERAVRRYPDATAVICGPVRLSVAELDARATRLANGLLGLGLAKGDRVATFLENSHHCVEVDFALAKAGLVRASVNPRCTAAELDHMLADSGAGALIFGAGFAASVAQADAARGLLLLRAEGDAPDGPAATDYEAFLQAAPVDPVMADIDPEDLYCLFYTSGTTGRPKGVMLSHRAILQVSYNLLMEAGPRRPGEKVLLMQPMSHGAGFFVLPWLMRGGASVIMRHFDPAEVIRLSAEHGIETVKLVPTMLQRILRLPREELPPLPHLRQIIYGASPIPTAALREGIATFGRRFVQIYGQSEAPVTLSVLPIEDHEPDGPHAGRLDSAGVPFPTVEMRILDEAGRDLPRGEPGEVVIRASHLMSGYWNRPDLSARAVRDGWLHTKDLGRIDAEGYLYLLGRTDEMINSGGYNIAPREVEEALYRHPAVQEVAVTGEPDETWGSAVVAYVALKPGMAAGDLRDFARPVLGFKTPKRFYRVEELPKSPNGKIQKIALSPGMAIAWEDGPS